MEGTQTQPETTYVSPIGDPLVIGDPGDVLPSPQEVLEVVSILQRAGMTFCVTQISALIYYGAPRVTSVKYPERFQLTVLTSNPGSSSMCPGQGLRTCSGTL